MSQTICVCDTRGTHTQAFVVHMHRCAQITLRLCDRMKGKKSEKHLSLSSCGKFEVCVCVQLTCAHYNLMTGKLKTRLSFVASSRRRARALEFGRCASDDDGG